MRGRAVIVTGAARGLGRAVAGWMGAHGAMTVLTDLDAAGAEAAAAGLRAEGREAVAVSADLTRPGAAREVVAAALGAFGRLDVLVNNAGDYTKAPIAELSDEAWRRMFDVNLKSTFDMMVAAVEPMRRRGEGRIVNVASIDAFIAKPTLVHYAAAKAGVVSLTKSFALAYGPDGILVNAVAPGPIATERAKSEGWLEPQAKATPLGRAAEPADIAEVIGFLASPANRCVTGETVIASCGLLML